MGGGRLVLKYTWATFQLGKWPTVFFIIVVWLSVHLMIPTIMVFVDYSGNSLFLPLFVCLYPTIVFTIICFHGRQPSRVSPLANIAPHPLSQNTVIGPDQVGSQQTKIENIEN